MILDPRLHSRDLAGTGRPKEEHRRALIETW